jgi:chromosome segregation ATPase
VQQELGQAASNWDRRHGMVDKTIEVDEAEAKFAELQIKYDQSQDDLSQSQDDLSQSKDDFRLLQEEIKQYESNIADLELELEGVKLDKRGLEIDFQGAIESTGKKDYKNEVKERDLQEEIDDLNEKVCELRHRLQDYGAEWY